MMESLAAVLIAATMTAATPPAQSISTPSVGAVRLDHGQLMRDGRPWVPHGVVQIAFVAPPATQSGVFAAAYKHYSPDDYRAMRALGIDSVRLQISQPGLDPQSKLFDPVFRDRVIAAARAARAAGLTVLLSVQDEKQSGEPSPTLLPNDGTRRIWKSLSPLFGEDPGVMFELLNEPRPSASPKNWHAWGAEMDATIAIVRDAGAKNVIVADGLLFAERLTGAPRLHDPLGQVVYASHPYAHNPKGETLADWDRKFGDFARTHPVIVTEWTTSRNFYCAATTPASALAFLSYLRDRRIGLIAFAWDFSGHKFGSAFHGFPPRATSYGDLKCGDPGFGPGEAIMKAYRQGP